MLRVKNEKDLLSILKVISQEAVVVSKKLNENSDTNSYKKQLRKDEEVFGDLKEQESQNDEEEESAEEEPQPEKSAEDNSAVIASSFDSIVKAVNNLRSGQSLKDKSIKQQAQVYYDKLSDAERTTLQVFLDALSKIIAGQIDGKDAQDPGDPPSYIKIEKESEEEDKSEPQAKPQADQPSKEPQSLNKPQEDSEDLEDTSPPIKVNESQEIELLRKKVKRMMLRG